MSVGCCKALRKQAITWARILSSFQSTDVDVIDEDGEPLLLAHERRTETGTERGKVSAVSGCCECGDGAARDKCEKSVSAATGREQERDIESVSEGQTWIQCQRGGSEAGQQHAPG